MSSSKWVGTWVHGYVTLRYVTLRYIMLCKELLTELTSFTGPETLKAERKELDVLWCSTLTKANSFPISPGGSLERGAISWNGMVLPLVGGCTAGT